MENAGCKPSLCARTRVAPWGSGTMTPELEMGAHDADTSRRTILLKSLDESGALPENWLSSDERRQEPRPTLGAFRVCAEPARCSTTGKLLVWRGIRPSR